MPWNKRYVRKWLRGEPVGPAVIYDCWQRGKSLMINNRFNAPEVYANLQFATLMRLAAGGQVHYPVLNPEWVEEEERRQGRQEMRERRAAG